MPQVSSAAAKTDAPSKMRRTVSKLLSNDVSDLSSIPSCSHGPALKFNRVDKSSGLSREFYACSANRDRKICSLFHWVEDWERKLKRGVPVYKDADESRRVKKSRPDSELGVSALVDNESNAQFLFDKTTVQNLVTIIKDTLAAASTSKPVLCIGAPSIHAALVREGLASVLLDEDERLGAIHDNTFHRFNMFNGTFYGKTFGNNDNYSFIVSDPPFHPELLPAMFSTIERLFPKSFATSPMMFAFPYFNATLVQAAMPKLQVTDLRLTYRNHKKYTCGEQSPVRLFVANLTLSTHALVSHKFCAPCNQTVHVANVHCTECNRCTSIAGSKPYVHCNECKHCVKPNSIHCKKCKRCHVGPHRDAF